MGKIDEPLDQTAFVHRGADDERIATLFGVAGPILGIMSQAQGAAMVAGLAAVVAQFWSKGQVKARLDAFEQAVRDAYLSMGLRIEALERAVESLLDAPAAQEALAAAVQGVVFSASEDKARRFGRIVGGTLAADAPNWQEADAFIRTLEQVGEDDMHALNVVWNHQRTGARVRGAGGVLHMSTDANDYTGTWSNVMESVVKAGISNDDWESRCARLSGFGLMVTVRANPAHQDTKTTPFRLTGRAGRLMQLLGRNVDPGAYPAVRYHRDGSQRTVQNEDEDRALGEGWIKATDR